MDSTSPPKHRDKKSKKHKDAPLKRKRPSNSPKISKKPRLTAIAAPTPTTASAENASPFRLTTTSLYLSVSPRYSYWPETTFSHLLNNSDPSARLTSEQAARMRSFTPINGLQKDHLNPLLMSYYEPVGGVVIAYSNIRFETDKARIIAESPFAHVWVTVDFLVWAPKKGSVLQGWVNLQSASHVGLLVENTWNVSIPKERIPVGWSYHEVREGFVPKKVEAPKERVEGSVEEGAGMGMEDIEYAPEHDTGGWMDDSGEYVDGLLRFQVESVKAMGHIFSMDGSLLNTEAIENAVFPGAMDSKKEKEKKKKKKKKKKRSKEGERGHKKSKSTA